MIKYIIILLTFSLNLFAAAQMQLDLSSAVVKQGSLIDVIIRLDGNSVQQVELQKLKGVSLADTIYLYQASSLVRSGDKFEADGKIIFLKVPESKPIIHKIGTSEISINWSDVEVQPTEAPAKFIFGQFEIPARRRIIEILAALFALSLIGFGIYKYNEKSKQRKALRLKKAALKDKVISAREYNDVVALWQDKAVLLKEFPHLQEPLKELEEVLFKYQFKQSQNEVEKAEVMTTYRVFMNKIAGGFNGI